MVNCQVFLLIFTGKNSYNPCYLPIPIELKSWEFFFLAWELANNNIIMGFKNFPCGLSVVSKLEAHNTK